MAWPCWPLLVWDQGQDIPEACFLWAQADEDLLDALTSLFHAGGRPRSLADHHSMLPLAQQTALDLALKLWGSELINARMLGHTRARENCTYSQPRTYSNKPWPNNATLQHHQSLRLTSACN